MSTYRALSHAEHAFMTDVVLRWRDGVRELPPEEFDRVRELFSRWPMRDESGRLVNRHSVFCSDAEPREHLMFRGEPLLRAKA